MFALLAALALSVQAEAALPASPAQSVPIRVDIIGGSRFSSGDRVRVQVQTADDGYLVVLRVDTDGHIRMLFPIDPDLDAFVRGGKTYELRGRADRQTFLADEHNGSGVIYAAIAAAPIQFREFSVGDHWDYNVLRLRDSADDPEAELSRIVAQMTGNRHFDYDIVDYTVTGPYIAAVGGAYPTTYGTYGSYYGNGWDPYYNCLGCRWGYRSSCFGVQLGFGGYYDPYLSACGFGGYDPYYYGYYSYPGSYWRYPGQGLPITVINLPRPHIPTTPYGLRSRPRQPIPALGGDLARPGRASSLGGGSSVVGGGTSPGTKVGERSRPPASRPTTRGSEPPQSSPPPKVDRVPPSSGGSGSSGAGSSGAGSSGSVGTRSRPRGGGGEMQDASTISPAQRVAPVSIDRRSDVPRPVYREPPRVEPRTPPQQQPSRPQPPRPVYREPTREVHTAPPPMSVPTSRPATPVVSSPPPSSGGGGSAPPASGGGSTSSPPRSRPGGGGGH